jgi:hypothetical protein
VSTPRSDRNDSARSAGGESAPTFTLTRNRSSPAATKPFRQNDPRG